MPPPARAATLDDRYTLESGRVFLTGVQALVRLPMEQARRDAAAGLRIGTYVTGYPGSPLGGYDLALARARDLCQRHGIVHRPAANEEMAATALMGTQLLERYPHARYDGVVGFWYGKGPGLDRAGDAVRHGNYAGTTRHGAVVILSGEDHEAKSSTMPFAQEPYFVHAGVPVLYPASVAEFLELGLHAVALSRYAGLWVALKLVAPLCDGGETVEVAPGRPATALPEDFAIGGRPFQKRQYHRFFPTETVETERVLYAERLPAALAYSRANGLDRVVVGGARDRLAVVAAGKPFSDVRQALSDLGLDDAALSAGGVRLVKLGLVSPLDAWFLADALRGLEEVVVVEEKRGLLEAQVKEALYSAPHRPRVLGKRDERGAPLFPEHGGFDADLVAERLAPRLLALPTGRDDRIRRRLQELRALRERELPLLARRTPTYCSGCPHNVSTRILPGQVAWSAPGCHVFATLIEQPERHADATFQLGGEGLAWIGLAPFSDRAHVIQNQGDGALFHSSYLNIRYAVAAGVNITFRILYNGAVANTGAQPPVGQRDVPTLARLLALEGVKRIAIVAREPRRYAGEDLPAVAAVHPREDLERLLGELERTPGVTVLLYDGECANERRRQRRRGLRPGPTRFVLVNEAVCEDCGHCGAVSNCMSVRKVDTEYGPKTRIHQPSCNGDELCLLGDCPAFVTVLVEGGGLRRPSPPPVDPAALPAPPLARADGPYRIVLPGVGGTGVLTASAILSFAALLEGKEVLSYDQTGAAQKWGAVLSTVAVADRGARPASNRVGLGQADLYLALDLMAAADPANLARCTPARTAAVVNTSLLPSGEVIRDARLDPGAERMAAAVEAACHPSRTVKVEARRLAEELLGDDMGANVLVLGVASQAGLLPVSPAAIEEAIRVNGTAVEANLTAFRHGRLHVVAPERVDARLRAVEDPAAEVARREAAALGRDGGRYLELLRRCADLPEPDRRRVAVRAAELVRYQDLAYAARYLDAVAAALRREREALGPGADPAVTRAVLEGLHKLMAYKDEYEVARLHLAAGMQRRAEATFDGRVRIRYRLQPPTLRALGLRRKLALGRPFEMALRLLAASRRLRGTALDPFGRAEVRRLERRLPGWYLGVVEEALAHLAPATRRQVLEVARVPDDIRGYEQRKLTSAARAMERAATIVEGLRGSAAPAPARALEGGRA